MPGPRRTARCSPMPGCGCARNGFRSAGETTGSRASRARRAAVRKSVGVCDVSTLGKIDMQGPDAAAFLDRVYVNEFSTLPVGKRALRPDAARGRLRHRRRHDCAARPSIISSRPPPPMPARSCSICEFCHQVLWPELDVHCLGDRPMGADRGRRARSRDCSKRVVDRRRYLQRGFPCMGARR